jgi:hypothetical protein
MSSRLVIGITGHRPNRLTAPDAVAVDMGRVLDGIAAAARGFAPQMISALAEGADRIAAQVALARGWPLTAVLPFAREEYEKDFSAPGSLAAFAAFVARADDVVALPGDGGQRPEAYEAAGFWMLDRAAILIAVWDGGVSRGRGGTNDIVRAALERGRAVIRVDATGRLQPHILGTPTQDAPARIAAAAIGNLAGP